MITYDDVADTTKWIIGNFCYSCREKITKGEEVIKVALLRDVDDVDWNTRFKRKDREELEKFVLFHVNCWRNDAGDNYMFSEE